MFEFNIKTAIVTMAAIAALFLVIGSAGWLSNKSQNISERAQEGESEDVANPLNLELKTDQGRTNILLLGISGPEYISGSLTDTIILASTEPDKNRADLISIPRDMWVFYEAEGYPSQDATQYTYSAGWQKINEIYQLAGGEEKPIIEPAEHVARKISEITGQGIQYTVVINLSGFQKVIDALGGITIGQRQMAGEEAINYIRDRSTPGGDFDRMKRQQEVLLAIQNKLGKDNGINFLKLLEIYNIVNENIATNAGTEEFLGFYDILGDISSENVNMYAIELGENNLLREKYINIRGQEIYTLLPRDGDENYGRIQAFISDILTD